MRFISVQIVLLFSAATSFALPIANPEQSITLEKRAITVPPIDQIARAIQRIDTRKPPTGQVVPAHAFTASMTSRNSVPGAMSNRLNGVRQRQGQIPPGYAQSAEALNSVHFH
ncbi:hypothetical protein M408DRAFT_332358 [Serendipita vermifera MAFF 305830]|uniref:Uncharacterized protein n=1 Tax=Serendipita vermifera MAFF 305830 TaxID=933852 RepID=A0A0C3AFK9_SERVB|nr:hypothetical protein M408DRAFT_332358 [Serendipita vermifera MAFF 305830]